MNAVNLLMQEHRRVKKLFSELETAPAGKREGLVCQMQLELLSHMAAEERVFYPALRASAQSQSHVDGAIEGHTTARNLIEEFGRVDVTAENFAERLSDVAKSIQEHIR